MHAHQNTSPELLLSMTFCTHMVSHHCNPLFCFCSWGFGEMEPFLTCYNNSHCPHCCGLQSSRKQDERIASGSQCEEIQSIMAGKVRQQEQGAIAPVTFTVKIRERLLFLSHPTCLLACLGPPPSYRTQLLGTAAVTMIYTWL